MSAWTPERTEDLRSLHSDGVEYSTIARTLTQRYPHHPPVSFGAVASKVSRLGLADRSGTTSKKFRRQRPRTVAKSTASPVDDCPNRVSLEDIKPHQCRWPLGDTASPDFRFCGADALPGQPYCAHHADIAFDREATRKANRRAKEAARSARRAGVA